ncbi:unnamed protein product [Phytophthora lilii]|uniref:Unnamed protein product n=1 Tax=Phytophthora lilii TaxID=2077276 RepID=A0A9W6TGJ1_9STRA|nr:unnamed protein product [Phytophthora lilii]
MSPAMSTASSWTSMQSKVTTPRSMSRARSAWDDDEADVSASANSSRYRVLDDDQKNREDVKRIIDDIEAQRRYRSPSNHTKRSFRRQEAAVVPNRSGSPRLQHKPVRRISPRHGSHRRSFGDSTGAGDEMVPDNDPNLAEEVVSQSFQEQVLEELRKLKEAQRIEFEALERLQREKDEAERKAHRLEEKLRKQQQQLSRKGNARSYEVTSKTKVRRQSIRHEDYDSNGDNNEIYSSNNLDKTDIGDECEKDEPEEGDPELIDWDDVTTSPPPYFTITSPARQALAQQRKSQQLKDLEREMNAELAREKRAKARDIPLTTYLSADDAKEAEQKRKERIRLRAQKMMQSAELPPRMAVANKKATSNVVSCGEDAAEVGHMSIQLKNKLRAAAEEEAERQKRRPKPVPNFDQLHSRWEAALKKKKELARRNHQEDEVVNDDNASSKAKTAEFFTSRAAKLAELQQKKEARKQRLQAKEEAIRQHAKRAQEKLLERARASLGKDAGSQRKPTKSETLRVQKLMAEAVKQQKDRQREEREADARERRREEAARRVRAQVKRSENVRRDNYTGNLVDLKDVDAMAKEKAREQRQQFKEAIARNKEKLLAAAAARPSLMERFTTSVKRETHRRAALEAVVKTVFQKDLSVLKDVLTDDEQELAREMVAADDKGDDKTSEGD